jgi:hypothetical protein
MAGIKVENPTRKVVAWRLVKHRDNFIFNLTVYCCANLFVQMTTFVMPALAGYVFLLNVVTMLLNRQI